MTPANVGIYEASNGAKVVLFTFGLGTEWTVRIPAQEAK